MSFSSDDIARLARLARIHLDAADTADVRRKLDAIFALIDTLQAIETTGVVPMAHAQDVSLPLRADARVAAAACHEYEVAPQARVDLSRAISRSHVGVVTRADQMTSETSIRARGA